MSERGIRRTIAVAAVAWMVVIFALSSRPGSAVPGRFGSLGHFVLYSILGALYLLALPRLQPWWRAALLAVLLASAYGVTDEFHQSFVPDRTPDVVDWLVDTVAAATAALAVSAWLRRTPKA